MRIKINNKLIRSFDPCYDPSELGIPDDELLSIKDWVLKYRGKLKTPQDIFWLLCREKFMHNKDMRLFTAWCLKQTINYWDKTKADELNVYIGILEDFANSKISIDEFEKLVKVQPIGKNLASNIILYPNIILRTTIGDACKYILIKSNEDITQNSCQKIYDRFIDHLIETHF